MPSTSEKSFSSFTLKKNQDLAPSPRKRRSGGEQVGSQIDAVDRCCCWPLGFRVWIQARRLGDVCARREERLGYAGSSIYIDEPICNSRARYRRGTAQARYGFNLFLLPVWQPWSFNEHHLLRSGWGLPGRILITVGIFSSLICCA